MYIGIQHLHSYWAYLTIFMVLLAFLNAIKGTMASGIASERDRKLGLLTLIAVHLQLTIGIVLYFVSPITQSAMANFGAAMKDANLRLYAVEHPFVMIVTTILVTIAYSRLKKNLGNPVMKGQAIYFGLALLFLLSRIPWSTWLG